jgi:hypothetical protein
MTTKLVVGAVLLLALVGPAAHAEDTPAAAAAAKPSCCQGTAAAATGAAALDTKVAAMNAAQGAAKIDAMAAVVNELVTQHRAMHQEQGGCGGGTQQGCCGGACPMMQGHQGHGTAAPPTGGATP